MPSIAVALKEEITRLSKKAIKEAIGPLQKSSTRYRREIADLKRAIAALERDLKAARKGVPERKAPSESEDEGGQMRFQAKGLRSLRARLGLSAGDFGKLVGVSGQTIYNWESEKAVPRRAQMRSLASIRGIGKREALSRLEAGTTA